MPAYVIVDIQVHDPVKFEEYKKQAPASIAAYGGKYLARGGASETLDGTWAPERVVLLEFPSMDRAREWYNSEKYAEAIRLRHASATSQFLLVEGLL
jgi:uncharacterized protein (DUF1330 family)